MDRNHVKFLNHLNESKEAVWFAAQWLHSQGYCVRINNAPKSPNHESWKKYADQGDIEISSRIEVKRLGITFTGLADWPFSDFIVCARHAFDNALPKPEFFIILSNDLKALAIVSGKKSNTWSVSKRKDSRYEGIEQEFYICPFEYVHWRILESFD